MHIVNLFFSLVFIVGLSVIQAQNVEPSRTPPGGLQPSQCPQFVNIGFDDNGFASGMTWFADFIRNKKNPAGNGNAGTFDGTPVRTSFYMTSSYQQSNSWKTLYNDGHAINNHTVNHKNGGSKTDITGYPPQNYTVAEWENEMNTCNSYLQNNCSVPANEILGFRVPFLSYNENCYTALANIGFLYDCSLEGAWDGDGTNYYWPYTLHNGSLNNNVGSHAGLWEVPTHPVLKTNGSKVTGLDYNMWAKTDWGGANCSKSEFVAILKHTLDLRYNGNRCPMTFGAHTDEYAPDNSANNEAFTNSTCTERQQAIEEFINYAMTKPDVRIVPTRDIIKWMRNPVKLNDINIVDTTDPSESLLEIAGWEAEADEFGSTVDTGSAIINSGVMKVSFNQVAQPDSTKWPWVSVTAYTDPDGKFDNLKWIKVTYKCDKPVLISLPQVPLSDEGTSYQLEIPTASSFQTALVKIADFKQPSWVTTTTPLDLTIIHDVMFAPVVDAAAGGSATIEINDVILYGYQEATSIGNNFSNAIPSGLFINKVSHEHINISIPENGAYTLSIYSVDGKLIKTVGNQYLTGGSQSITWNGNVLGTKLYLITLQGNNVQTSKKVLIQ